MLHWLVCRLAPPIVDLTDVPAPELPEPASHDRLAERAAATFAELAAVPFRPAGVTDPYRVLLAMGCRDFLTRAADTDPVSSGRAPTYERFGGPWEPLTIPLPGGPTLTGHHSVGAPGQPIVLVLHGLFDSHVSVYVAEYAEVLRRWGFHVVALDLRDHGQLLGKPPMASLGLFEGKDVLAAAKALARAEGVSVGVLGISYGGHCAVRAAYEASVAGEAEVLRGGVLAICPPLDIHEATLALDDTARLPAPHGLLQRFVIKGLIGVVRKQLQARAGGRRVESNEPFEGFLRDVVLPAYPNEPSLVGAFLAKARCTQEAVLSAIAVPTAILHPVDDPFVPVEHARKARELARSNPWIHVRELPAGGHGGTGVVDGPGTLALLSTFFGRLRDG